MFHIALLLLLAAGHEWLLRPIGVSPVTSKEKSPVTPVNTDSHHDLVTVNERDEIRTLFEITMIHKYRLNKYYRADGTEKIEVQVNILRLTGIHI